MPAPVNRASSLAPGTLPTVWDPGWQAFTGLSAAQIAAYQAFPQDLLLYSARRREMAELSGVTVTFNPPGAVQSVSITLDTRDTGKLVLIGHRQALDDGGAASFSFHDSKSVVHTVDGPGLKAVHAGLMAFVTQLWSAHAANCAGINATPQTITTRAQIDAAYAPIAPNSPSALGLG